RDIQWRQEVDQCDQRQADEQRQERRHQIRVLDSALHAENLPTGTDDELRLDACIRFLGRTPAPLVIVPLEDVMAEMEQPNLPGAPDSHPNWRRRWPLPASRMLEQPGGRPRLKNLDEERRNLARKQTKCPTCVLRCACNSMPGLPWTTPWNRWTISTVWASAISTHPPCSLRAPAPCTAMT